MANMQKPNLIAQRFDRAIKLLEKPGSWCQGQLARNHLGNSVPVDADSAISFCILGSLLHKQEADNSYYRAKGLLSMAIGNGSCIISSWNDTTGRTRQEVLAALAKAKELANDS